MSTCYVNFMLGLLDMCGYGGVVIYRKERSIPRDRGNSIHSFWFVKYIRSSWFYM